jgi:hypothetical protein
MFWCLEGLFLKCDFGISFFVLQRVLTCKLQESKFKANTMNHKFVVNHAACSFEICVHVFICMILLVSIVLGANLVAHDNGD